jgi:uncharacterized protein
MYAFNVITLLLVIIGGLNWLLVGLFQFDLVATFFDGTASGQSRTVYVMVGLSAIWQLVPFFRAFDIDEATAQLNR